MTLKTMFGSYREEKVAFLTGIVALGFWRIPYVRFGKMLFTYGKDMEKRVYKGAKKYTEFCFFFLGPFNFDTFS
ncbi:MAG: hypothetical protein ACU84J_11615, partial [Gammaproteobacteria bacterium]